MRRDFLSFIGGMLVGAIFGVLVGEEDKKKIRQTLTKQIKKLRKEYEGPIKESADKVKSFWKEHLS